MEPSDRITLREPNLPSWPFLVIFVGFPLWWLVGLADAVWFVGALPMLCYLVRERYRIVLPKGFGLWILFTIWMLATVIQIDTSGRLLGFAFRASVYVGIGVIFVYVYNAREALPQRRVAGALAVYWVVAIAGGYLGILRPYDSLRTVMSYLVPASIQSNDFVSQMLVPHFAQGNPDGYYQFAPRPSAPFDYTNTWGTSYSLLIPFVFLALSKLPRHRLRFWALLAMVPISLLPAFETQNRGMFLGVGVGLAYVAVRFALRGDVKWLLALLAFGLTVYMLVQVLPVQSDLEARVSTGASNDTRLAIYDETFDRTLQSPVFGYGAPRPSLRLNTEEAPAVGTQGQLWIVMFSNGFVGLVMFYGWLLLLFFRTIRAQSSDSVWLNAVVLMGIFESIYYGLIGSGLCLMMIAGALALRELRQVPLEPLTPPAPGPEQQVPARQLAAVSRHSS